MAINYAKLNSLQPMFPKKVMIQYSECWLKIIKQDKIHIIITKIRDLPLGFLSLKKRTYF